jgi:hypothetical protein
LLTFKLVAVEEPEKGMLEPHTTPTQLISVVLTRPIDAEVNVPVMCVVKPGLFWLGL